MLGLVMYNIGFSKEANVAEKDYESIINRIRRDIDKKEFNSIMLINGVIKDICADFGTRLNCKSADTADTYISNYTSSARRKFHVYRTSKTEVVYDIHDTTVGSLFIVIVYEKSSRQGDNSVRIVKCDTTRCTATLATYNALHIIYSVSNNGRYSYESTPIKTMEETKVLVEELNLALANEEISVKPTVKNTFVYDTKRPSYEMMRSMCNNIESIMTSQQITMSDLAKSTKVGQNAIRELPIHMEGLDNLIKVLKGLGYNVDLVITKRNDDMEPVRSHSHIF